MPLITIQNPDPKNQYPGPLSYTKKTWIEIMKFVQRKTPIFANCAEHKKSLFFDLNDGSRHIRNQRNGGDGYVKWDVTREPAITNTISAIKSAIAQPVNMTPTQFEDVVSKKLKEIFGENHVINDITVPAPPNLDGEAGDPHSWCYQIDHLALEHTTEGWVLWVIESKGQKICPAKRVAAYYRGPKEIDKSFKRNSLSLWWIIDSLWRKSGDSSRKIKYRYAVAHKEGNCDQPSWIVSPDKNPWSIESWGEKEPAINTHHNDIPTWWEILKKAQSTSAQAETVSYVEAVRDARTMQLLAYKGQKELKKSLQISGTAGSGKTALLAYHAIVCSTKKRLDYDRIKTASDKGELLHKEEFLPIENIGEANDLRKNVKKIEVYYPGSPVVKNIYDTLKDHPYFKDAEVYAVPSFISTKCNPVSLAQATALKAGNTAANEYTAILVDEAQDIELIPEKPQENTLLFIARDRLQCLSDKKFEIPDLIKKELRSVVLNQPYRSPVPITLASFAILGAWTSENTEKYMPKDTSDFLYAIGANRVKKLTKENYREKLNEIELGNENNENTINYRLDVHPLSRKTNGHCCLKIGTEETTRSDGFESLEIRFGENCVSASYTDNTDKYYKPLTINGMMDIAKKIKGREWPLVTLISPPAKFKGEDDKTYRQFLYICASRASCYLHIIGSQMPDAITLNLLALEPSVINDNSPGVTWSLKFHLPKECKPMDLPGDMENEKSLFIIGDWDSANGRYPCKPYPANNPNHSKPIFLHRQKSNFTKKELPNKGFPSELSGRNVCAIIYNNISSTALYLTEVEIIP